MTLSTVRCQILGKAEIHTRGIRINPETEVQFGLAMYFCAHAGRQVPRDEVARLFWPDTGIEAARHNLRQSLYRLRVLGVPVRSGAKSSVLETHMVDADYAPVVAEGAPASVYLRLSDVTVLPGYSPKFSRPYARWVEEFRSDVGTQMRRGLVRAIAEMRARGRYADVERLCRFCLALDPLNEEATLALAESVALAGGKVEAVGMIDRYAGEVSRYPTELRLPASLLRERISDRLIRRAQAQMELPMIGREEDVERVVTAFQRLRGNQSVSYIVTGVSGVGKTRLATECCRIAALQGARVITIGTQPSSRTQALFAVSELVDHMLQLPGAIGCAPSALECLRAMSAPFTAREPRLSMETDGEARFAMVRWSILDVIDAVLSEGPLLIHIDDAHQMDPQSQLILQDALQTHAGRPLLLLTTMRPWAPEDNERFEHLASVSTMHELPPLSDDSCDRLVHRFCTAHDEVVDEHTRERIIQLSGGNPFFLLELLKHRSNLTTDDLPVSVQALLEDRLTKLSPRALTVLRAAAVLGLSSNVERLHRVVERNTSDVLVALTELHSAGMLSSHDSGTVCRHDSIRDAVLERTPTAARQLLHRRAAKVLGTEVRRGAGVAELWECLDHWRAAGLPGKGVRLVLKASRRLLRLGLAEEAAKILEEALRTATTTSDRARTLSRWLVAAALLRDWETVRSSWRSLEVELAKAGRRVRRHGKLELLALEAHQYMSGVTATAGEALACAQATDAPSQHRLEAGLLAMMVADNNADTQLSKHVRIAVADVAASSASESVTRLCIDMVFEATFGSTERAAAHAMELAAVAETLNPQPTRAQLQRRACCALRVAGNLAKARELALASLELTSHLHLHRHSLAAIELLTGISYDEGNLDAGLKWLEQLRDLESQHSTEYSRAVRYCLEAKYAYALGDLSQVCVPREGVAAYLANSIRRPAQRMMGALCAHALIMGDAVALRGLLPALRQGHEQIKYRGLFDFETAVLIDILMNEPASKPEARTVALDYIANARRDGFAPGPTLARSVGAAGLDLVKATRSRDSACASLIDSKRLIEL